MRVCVCACLRAAADARVLAEFERSRATRSHLTVWYVWQLSGMASHDAGFMLPIVMVGHVVVPVTAGQLVEGPCPPGRYMSCVVRVSTPLMFQ